MRLKYPEHRCERMLSHIKAYEHERLRRTKPFWHDQPHRYDPRGNCVATTRTCC